jgi:hypothetical protein
MRTVGYLSGFCVFSGRQIQISIRDRFSTFSTRLFSLDESYPIFIFLRLDDFLGIFALLSLEDIPRHYDHSFRFHSQLFNFNEGHMTLFLTWSAYHKVQIIITGNLIISPYLLGRLLRLIVFSIQLFNADYGFPTSYYTGSFFPTSYYSNQIIISGIRLFRLDYLFQHLIQFGGFSLEDFLPSRL